MGLELPRGHRILVLRLMIRVVPLLHLLGIRRGVRRSIVLRVVVGHIRIVDRRVRLRRDMVVVLRVTLPPSWMERYGRRYVRAWHHERPASVLPSQSGAGWGIQRARQRGEHASGKRYTDVTPARRRLLASWR